MNFNNKSVYCNKFPFFFFFYSRGHDPWALFFSWATASENLRPQLRVSRPQQTWSIANQRRVVDYKRPV